MSHRLLYIRNNFPNIVFLLGFICINATLFTFRLFQYSGHGTLIMIARANGQCLNFTCTFIIICVLKRTITFLRSMGCSEYLPLDHHIYYHKLMGWTILILSTSHTIMHVTNFVLLSKTTTIPWYEYLISPYHGIGWVYGTACITGWIILIILLLIVITALPFVRKSGKFEIFYYTHLLYILFYICLFIHAPNFWMWFIGPCIVFLIEIVMRIMRSFGIDGGLIYIEQGVLLPSRVIQLIIRRPSHFEYNPGDYLYIQIPGITKYEWHPFTISSAPEQSEIIWLHIRAAGEWTNRLYNYFHEHKERTRRRLSNISSIRGRLNQISPSNFQQKALIMVLPVPDDYDIEISKQKDKMDIEMITSPENRKFTSSFKKQKIRSPFFSDIIISNVIHLEKPLKVRIDGPYGSPSSHIFHTQHAVLIATGIGVTPFASILQSIMQRYIEAKRVCPNCRHHWFDPIPPKVMKLQKVDFLWINRDQKSFEWFVNLLNDMETQQREIGSADDRFLDIHMHMTQPKVKKKDIERGDDNDNSDDDFDDELKVKICEGRPDFDKFFREVKSQKKGRVTVFFCGRNDVAKCLKNLCINYGFMFRKEIF